MKKIFSLVVMACLFSTAAAFSSEGTRVKNWNNVQTYDIAALQKDLAAQRGKVIGVRCHFRGKEIRHMKPNWYESSIWQKDPSGSKFVDVRVMVAKKDLPAFKSITTEPGENEIVLYGRAERDVEANFLFVRLLGRTANIDSSGNATITW
jgi:hypothetical protein